MKRYIELFIIAWLIAGVVSANPVLKKIKVDGFEREYLVYLPSHPIRKKAEGVLVCLHSFSRSMHDFFYDNDFTSAADSLNLIMVALQALPEQNQRVNLVAASIGSFTDNRILLNSVWGCGLRIKANLLLLGTSLLNEELNKDVDDVNFIDKVIDETLSDNALDSENIFVLGTSMGGFMAYQYALKKGERLSGIISVAGSMGLEIKGMDNGVKVPVCDFHSVTDEVVPYTGSQIQSLSVITLAQPKPDVLNYWRQKNETGNPVTEQIKNYPSTNKITVEKITYPAPVNEVVHYKATGASHSYFFKKENGDCMDHVEEIMRFIRSHLTVTTPNAPIIEEQKPFFYPNPVVDKIYFKAVNGIVSIYDITGMEILSRSFTEGQADLKSLRPGLYFIHIRYGNTVYTDKLIKK